MSPDKNERRAISSALRERVDPAKAKTGPITMVESLMALMGKLTALLAREIELIEQRRLDEHAELLKLKQRLTLDYRAGLKTIALQPGILKDLPEDLRQAARAASQALAEVSARNARALRSAITSVQTLAQTVVSLVRDEVMPKNGYLREGKAAGAVACYSPTCEPIMYNQKA